MSAARRFHCPSRRRERRPSRRRERRPRAEETAVMPNQRETDRVTARFPPASPGWRSATVCKTLYCVSKPATAASNQQPATSSQQPQQQHHQQRR